MASSQKGLLGMFNMFSGGAVTRMAIFALGIMPYISSSIIVQLLTGVSDYFKNLKEQGEIGRKKITQITRYGTVLIACLQGYGVSVGLEWQKIQEQFKILVKKFHPDMNSGNKKYEEKLKLITLAYTQLKNTYKEKIDT